MPGRGGLWKAHAYCTFNICMTGAPQRVLLTCWVRGCWSNPCAFLASQRLAEMLVIRIARLALVGSTLRLRSLAAGATGAQRCNGGKRRALYWTTTGGRWCCSLFGPRSLVWMSAGDRRSSYCMLFVARMGIFLARRTKIGSRTHLKWFANFSLKWQTSFWSGLRSGGKPLVGMICKSLYPF